jgi:hypothetical protein
MITIHKDTVATSKAVTPDGTVFSARQTPPLPMKSSRKPVINDIRQCDAVGRTPVFHRSTGYSKRPVSKCREPASKSGGKDSIPIRIAKYVEPHTIYTRPNAMITNVDFGSPPRPDLDTVAEGSGSMVVDI